MSPIGERKPPVRALSSNALLLDTRLATIEARLSNIQIADIVHGGALRPIIDAVLEIEKLRKELHTIV